MMLVPSMLENCSRRAGTLSASASMVIDDTAPMCTPMSITDADGNDRVRARFHWQER